MERKRGSMASSKARARDNKTNKKGKQVIGEGYEPESQELYPFANIPSTITEHIMLQLPIKTLAICRLVCKTWNTLISSPHFTRLHLQCAPLSVMIRIEDYHRMSRTMYLFELEMLESMIWCYDYHRVLRPQLEMDDRNDKNSAKLGPAFKLPLCYARLSKDQRCRHNSYRRGDGRYGVVNSCNGLLCLHGPCKKELVICNPITGEFIKLPKAIRNENTLGCVHDIGFGFQPKTNEYKVVRIWEICATHERSLVVQTHTVGKPGWRNVGVNNEFLTKISHLAFPTCVNGALHWIYFDGRKRSILCFDFESESFQSFPSPPRGMHHFSRFGLAELAGFLYASDSSSCDSCIMWVMKSYGVAESWTKVFSIDNLGNCFWPYGLCWPVKQVEKGVAVLMQTKNCFVYYEPEKNGYKLLQVIGAQPKSFEVIPHIPSLVSLKDVVIGDNIRVLNVNSRCFKLKEEDGVLFLTGDSQITIP